MENQGNLKRGENSPKKEDFSFARAAEDLLGSFSERAHSIIVQRYGLKDGREATLEEIGSSFRITRERVRQIIKEVIKKSKEKVKNDPSSEALWKINFTLKGKNGIMTEEALVNNLSAGNAAEKSAIRFFIDLAKDVRTLKVPGAMLPSLASEDFNIDDWRKVNDQAKAILEEEGKLLSQSDLVSKAAEITGIGEKRIQEYLAVSETVKKNQFGRWGLSDWEEVSPKGTREKSYLVLKEAGKPLHFREIASLIDRYHLSKRPTNPQTVHNELIKDERFVLVGRGIYALKEWGYREGTVKDVLEEILKNSTAPMKREAILDRINEMRQVKKSTVIINLNNFFARVGKDEYTLRK